MSRDSARRAVLAAVLLLMGGVSVLTAHDFWLVPELFRVPEGWTVHVAGQTGMEFPQSDAAVAPARVATAELVSADERVGIDRAARSGSSLMMEARPPSDGGWWVAVALHPREITLSAEQFDRYLLHDGIWDVLERRRRESGAGPAAGARDSVRESYTKYAKALLQVGEGGPSVHGEAVGHPVEIVLLDDPFRSGPGEELRARVLWRGQPLAGQVVFAGREGAGSGPTSHAVTDDEGIARFHLFVPGRWYLKTIRMERAAEGSGLDYRSWWATTTFRVPEAESEG